MRYQFPSFKPLSICLYFSLSLSNTLQNMLSVSSVTFKVKILDLLESPNLSTDLNKLITPVTITYSDVVDKELEPGEELDVKIVVTYNPSTMISGLREFSYTVGLIAK